MITRNNQVIWFPNHARLLYYRKLCYISVLEGKQAVYTKHILQCKIVPHINFLAMHFAVQGNQAI